MAASEIPPPPRNGGWQLETRVAAQGREGWGTATGTAIGVLKPALVHSVLTTVCWSQIAAAVHASGWLV